MDSSTALSGATVTAYNEDTGETIALTNTSDSNGTYIIDCANFTTNGYSNGDHIVVSAYKTNTSRDTTKIIEYRTTIVTSTGHEEKDLTVTYYDVLDLVIDILLDNWRAGMTTNMTPRVMKVFKAFTKDMNYATNQKDLITVYERQTEIKQIAIGTGDAGRALSFPVTIDIGGRYSRMQTIKVRNEVDRILNASIVLSVSGYNILDPDGKWIDLSDKYTGLWRYVYDISIEKQNAYRTIGGG